MNLIIMKKALLTTLIILCYNISSIYSQNDDKTGKDALITNVTAIEADSMITANISNPDFFIIDVRTPGEYAVARISGSANVDYYNANFVSNICAFDTSKMYLVYCLGGTRSSAACNIMQSNGFQFVYNMLGGINQWMAVGNPVDSLYLGINEQIQTCNIEVYPNPCNGIINLKVNSELTDDCVLEIYDVSGNLVHKGVLKYDAKSVYNSDLSHLHGGLYLLNLRNDKLNIRRNIIII